MWSESETPALSIEQLAKHLRKSVAETKAIMEEYWRIKNAKAELVEKKAAEYRYKRGPARVNEELGDARPEIAMSRIRWLALHRASMVEKGDKGGSLLSEDSDFIPWLLKRSDMEHLRVKLARKTNGVGYTPALDNASARLANAAHFGRRERAGQAILDPQTKGWVPALITTA